jgi:polysaccharide chain length determinant protein (PEP-CTERM system associated)
MDNFLTMLQYDIRRMWDRRWLAAGIAWAAAVVLGLLVFTIRDRYEASARVYVDTQKAIRPLMKDLAFQPDIDQQVRMLAKTLISRANVEALFRDPVIGLDVPDTSKYDRAVEAMKDKIKVVPGGAGNMYAISYRDSDPARSQRLVEALVAIFVKTGSEGKSDDSKRASLFIEEQIKDYDTKLVDAENRLKEFKLRNFGVTGVTTGANQDHFSRLASLSDDVAKLRLSLASAEQSRDALKRELKSEDPQLPPGALQGVVAAQPSDLELRLQAQRRSLDELLRRYTENHPDVVSAKRVIAQIERQQREEAGVKVKPGADGKGSAATNPVYQRLRISLAEAEANLASLRSQLGVQQGRLDQVRALASRMPQVEAEFAQLNRDYEVVRKNYEQLVSRREAASLGVKIDESSELTDFRIIDPPRVSPTPVFPGRRALAVIAMLVSLIGAGAAVFGLGRMKPTVDSVEAMHELCGRPVLGAVSLLRSPEQRTQRWRDIYQFSGVMGIFLLLHVGWLTMISLRIA